MKKYSINDFFAGNVDIRCKNDKQKMAVLKECYLDELPPERGRMEDEISTECSVMCYLAENGLEE